MEARMTNTNSLGEKFTEYEYKKDAIVVEIMREIYARLPYGEKFQLSDGSIAYLRKLSEPKLQNSEHQHYPDVPRFGVDVIIEGGKLDHLELFTFQTGWGSAV